MIRTKSTIVPKAHDSVNHVSEEGLQWLIDRNIIYSVSGSEYGLTDEFLRIRLRLDALEVNEGQTEFGIQIARLGRLPDMSDLTFEREDNDDTLSESEDDDD